MRLAKICGDANAPFISYIKPKSFDSSLLDDTNFDLSFDEVELMDSGFMTFITFQSSDLVRLTRFQSISNTSPSLNGKWNNL